MRAVNRELHFFLNEWSFQGQFYDLDSFQRAAVAFLALIERARQSLANSIGTLWKSALFMSAEPIAGKPLGYLLNQFNREIYEQWRDIVYNRTNPPSWNSFSAQQEGAQYTLELSVQNYHDVSGTSIAELSARRLVDADYCGCLITISDSPSAGHDLLNTLEEIGSTKRRIQINSLERIAALEAWLNTALAVPAYGDRDTIPPTDEQTCLADRQRFMRTNFDVQGRRIFLEKTSERRMYVDNLHYGAKAHLEVFDRYKRHLGAALLTGVLISGTRDKNKDNKIPY